ncbi:ankyrin repeat and SAM domain-containing protein 4B [Pristis pectinata]|uniref:ankyrin repeat and SAM domain-containing protein 4B n=1 Tax=Pristis pectinata TaxID=685728 RepID=UPI00223CD427|nr:ankyrin repeat and SAM domain-containing protein 4B [Pristis pectinata]
MTGMVHLKAAGWILVPGPWLPAPRSSLNMSGRYHKAARDGYLGPLKEATRKDLNNADEDGMTPTLWAAYHGHLEALQLICSRGGDPDICDIWGNTPLHHASTNGHLHIITFLVNFGANIWALDNHSHSPMDAAASKGRMECVRFLDAVASRQTAANPRQVARLKEKARKDCERQVRESERRQRKHQSRMNKRYGRDTEARGGGTPGSGGGGDSGSHQAPAAGSQREGTLTSLLKGSLQKKLWKKEGSQRVLEGQPGKDVIFVSQASGRANVLEVFPEPSAASPDLMPAEVEGQRDQESLFNRPGLGNMLFRRNFILGLSEELEDVGSQVHAELLDPREGGEEADTLSEEEWEELPWQEQELGLDDEEPETTPLEVFLAAQNMSEFLPFLTREQIDLDSLMLCSDADLKSIHLPLGPRKKIISAVERRKLILESACELVDTVL